MYIYIYIYWQLDILSVVRSLTFFWHLRNMSNCQLAGPLNLNLNPKSSLTHSLGNLVIVDRRHHRTVLLIQVIWPRKVCARHLQPLERRLHHSIRIRIRIRWTVAHQHASWLRWDRGAAAGAAAVLIWRRHELVQLGQRAARIRCACRLLRGGIRLAHALVFASYGAVKISGRDFCD